MVPLARKTHSLIRHSVLALLTSLAGGACTEPVELVVKAEAKLVSIGNSGVRGSVDIGHGLDYPDDISIIPRWIVLPDDEPRGIAIYDATDCNVDQATARIFDPPSTSPMRPTKADGDLGMVRRLDGYGWFYEANRVLPSGEEYGESNIFNALLGDMTLEPGVPSSVIGKIVAVRGLDSADGRPGAWQACAPFVSTNYDQR